MQRADLVIKEMTLDEKISLLHGQGMPFSQRRADGIKWGRRLLEFDSAAGNSGDSDGGFGVWRDAGLGAGRYSTALPNNLAAASSWDPDAAYEYGELIGRELRDQGYNMTLGGGVNLPREPRNGRTFEYHGRGSAAGRHA